MKILSQLQGELEQELRRKLDTYEHPRCSKCGCASEDIHDAILEYERRVEEFVEFMVEATSKIARAADEHYQKEIAGWIRLYGNAANEKETVIRSFLGESLKESGKIAPEVGKGYVCTCPDCIQAPRGEESTKQGA